MRKLKLQMQITLDGFVTANKGGANFNWDNEVRTFSIANTAEVDCIILGRTTAKDFIPHWASVASNPGDPDHVFGKQLTDIPKIVFSNTLATSKWSNTKLAKGEISEEIYRLKKQTGKDMLVYGGSSFVSSLIKEGLIDQYYLLVNPVAIGNGLTIFQSLKGQLSLNLLESRQFSCGTILLIYEPKRD
jgi:dihydrofolate reductase